jgi:hypothetical protein
MNSNVLINWGCWVHMGPAIKMKWGLFDFIRRDSWGPYKLYALSWKNLLAVVLQQRKSIYQCIQHHRTLFFIPASSLKLDINIGIYEARKYPVQTHFQWKHGNQKVCCWIAKERSRLTIQLVHASCKETPASWRLLCTNTLLLSI